MPTVTEIRATLQARLLQLGEDVAALEAEATQPLDRDWEEQANQIEDIETSEGLEAVHLVEARQIRAAIARIDSGNYGVCAKCGSPIAPARLNAQPTATLCIACAT